MDPDANLKEQADFNLLAMSLFDKRRLRELRFALQEWLTSGGFPPNWKAHSVATKAFHAWQRKMVKFGDLVR